MPSFKYDVAFSFVAAKEDQATSVCDRLEGRVRTFIYSRHQEELAGTDGQESFGRVFEEEARVVVVVLSAGWGERGWTLIEKTAIQNRGLREGWDFLQVLPVEQCEIPKFIPRAHIYFDWNRWGIDGACSVIEAHVTRQGGEPKEPTFEGMASRKKREMDLEQTRERFRVERRGKGIAWAVAQTPILFSRIKERAHASPLDFQADERPKGLSVQASGVRMSVMWQQRWADVVQDSNLRIALHDTSDFEALRSSEGGGKAIGEPFYFVIDLDPRGEPAWRGEDRWLTTEQLSDYLLMRMVEHVKADGE